MTEQAEVVIIGGAVVGSAIAYFLTKDADFQGRIVVLERDRSYAKAGSSLSTSGVRQQFSTAVNVRLAQFTVEFLHNLGEELAVDGDAPDVRFHENGYLYLGDAAAVDGFEQNHKLHKAMGAPVELLDRVELSRRFPWMTVDDVEIGSLGLSGEGWTDGYGLMMAFRAKARANGADYRFVEASELICADGRVCGVRCADGTEILADHIVDAAGGEGRKVALMAGVDLPVGRVKQQIFAFDSPFHVEKMPYILGPDELLFRPEGQHYITGLAVGDDLAAPDDFEVEHDLFESEIWPRLAHRVQGFEQARPLNAWAGHYDMNLFDRNAIVGGVAGVGGFYIANGFSGHGLMQSPGIGRGVAELIVHGGYRTLDLTDLSFDRVLEGRPLRENIQY